MKNEIVNLYTDVDKMISLLLKTEPFWHKCHPCKNNGNCCIDSETMASAAEWHIISDHLAELSLDDFLTIRKNVDSGQNCAFRSPYKCLIHDVRPLVCRVVPYFAFERDGMVDFFYPAGTCSERKRIKGYVPIDQLDLTKIFFRIRPTEQAKSIHYLNGLRLSNHPSFDIIKRDEVKFVMVWLKEYFTRKN